MASQMGQQAKSFLAIALRFTADGIDSLSWVVRMDIWYAQGASRSSPEGLNAGVRSGVQDCVPSLCLLLVTSMIP